VGPDPGRYQQKSKTIAIEGYQLQWQIVARMTLSSGTDTAQASCTGIGVPWSATTANDPGACTVTYTTAGRYTLSAQVGWTVQWWLAGVRQADSTGPTKPGNRALVVREIQTVTR
jgi:hypothetical protein